jgi:hypothetical protein
MTTPTMTMQVMVVTQTSMNLGASRDNWDVLKAKAAASDKKTVKLLVLAVRTSLSRIANRWLAICFHATLPVYFRVLILHSCQVVVYELCMYSSTCATGQQVSGEQQKSGKNMR